jgi:hypothetical protein
MTNFLCFLHKRRIDRSWQQGVATLADDIGAAFFVGSILWNMFFGISKVLEWCLSDTSQRNSILHLYRLPVPDLGAVRVGYGERGGLEWPWFDLHFDPKSMLRACILQISVMYTGGLKEIPLETRDSDMSKYLK